MTPAEKRDRYLRTKYGLTLEQYTKMGVQQGFVCKICRRPRPPVKGKPRRPLNVDHDHRTKRVRGLLCYTCNHFMLARGCDHPELHDRAAEYLRSNFDGRTI